MFDQREYLFHRSLVFDRFREAARFATMADVGRVRAVVQHRRRARESVAVDADGRLRSRSVRIDPVLAGFYGRIGADQLLAVPRRCSASVAARGGGLQFLHLFQMWIIYSPVRKRRRAFSCIIPLRKIANL